jgi:hypothetical protein
VSGISDQQVSQALWRRGRAPGCTSALRTSTQLQRLAVAVCALLLAACGTATHTTAPTGAATQSAPAVTQTMIHKPPPSAPPKTVIGTNGTYWPVIDNDGTYRVWIDIPMGKYRNAGGKSCYWARLGSTDTSDIIESKKTSSPQEVTIRASDTAFLTQNCGTWEMVSAF